MIHVSLGVTNTQKAASPADSKRHALYRKVADKERNVST